MSHKPRVGVVGCGNISKSYLTNMQRHGILDVVACTDLDMERAKAKGAEYKIPKVLTPDQLYSDPDVEYVLNLTDPQAHLSVAMQAIANGKHVYNEKPLGATREEAQLLREAAKKKGLRVGCAPDTFMGAGMQLCRKVIDEGKIVEPFNAEVVFCLRGYKDLKHFHWKKGAGVLMDIGPYYFTAMAALLGPAKRLSAFARYSPIPELQQKFPDWKQLIEVPSHTSAIMEFQSGLVANVTLSTEMCGWYDVHFKIYGSEATLTCPDPNMFDGELVISAFGKEKERIKPEGPFATEGRGVGLADMALAQKTGRQHLANGDLAYHVLDIMCAIAESADHGNPVALTTAPERPALFGGFDQ